MAAERTPRPCEEARLGAVRGVGLDARGLEVRAALAGDRVLELAHAAAERTTQLGELLRPHDDERDDQDDDEFHGADRRHGESPWVSAGAPTALTDGENSYVVRACKPATNRPAGVAGSRTPVAGRLLDAVIQPVAPQRAGGHTRATARPMMRSVRIAPKSRESSELARLSPITKTVPGRTRTGPK